MCTTPEKHTKRRETLGNANQNKNKTNSWAQEGVWKKPQWKHLELKESREMLNKTKTLTTMATQKKAKEKALKWPRQTGKEHYENHSEKNRALQNAKKNNKTTKKKSSDRRRPSCKLQEQSLTKC